MAVIDKDRKQMTVKRKDIARACVFILKCKCCCLRLDLGQKVQLPAQHMDVERVKKVQS